MDPVTISAIASAAAVAAPFVAKGGKWGYEKWQTGRVEKKCIRTIMDAVPEDATRQDLRQARCAVRMYCSGKITDITDADKVCRVRKKGQN